VCSVDVDLLGHYPISRVCEQYMPPRAQLLIIILNRRGKLYAFVGWLHPWAIEFQQARLANSKESSHAPPVVPWKEASRHQDALPAMHHIRIEHHRPLIQTSKADDRDLDHARTDKRLKTA